MNEVMSVWDWILTPIYVFIIYMVAYRIKATQIDKHPEYEYFIKGLTFKIIGGIAFALVYIYYYGGGDTLTYFRDSRVIGKLLLYKPSFGLSVLADNLTPENYAAFDVNTYWPHLYIWGDHNTFTVVRYTAILNLLSFQSYLVTTTLLSCLSYIGIWKLFQLFYKYFKQHINILAIPILYLPSFVFWGSGIMKDTYIVGATCWISYNFYKAFIERKNIPINSVFMVMNFIIILNIKPYIVACLIPSMLFWINQAYIRKIKSAFFKALLLPFAIISLVFGGYYIFSNVGQSMGAYGNVDTAIEKAKVIQQDLLREEQYGSNNYDLGELDGSFSGMLKVAPIAIFTTLYRPFITEIGNIMMAFSALENLLLLLFSIYIVARNGPRMMLTIINQNPLILYSIILSLVLAFGVGIATANFGALVRYKIPLIPFFFSALFLIYKIGQEKRLERMLSRIN